MDLGVYILFEKNNSLLYHNIKNYFPHYVLKRILEPELFKLKPSKIERKNWPMK